MHKLIGSRSSRHAAISANMNNTIRVAVSVLCLVPCLLLLVLWGRSYSLRDSLGLRLYAARMVRVFSAHGVLRFETYANIGEQGSFVRSLSHEDISAAWNRFTTKPQPKNPPKWRWELTRTGRFYVHVPHWFLVLLIATLAGTLWINWGTVRRRIAKSIFEPPRKKRRKRRK